MYDTRIIVFADGEEAQAAYVAMTGRTPAGIQLEVSDRSDWGYEAGDADRTGN